jgi:hypothetical protein
MDPESLLSFFIDHGSLWVKSQRDRYRPVAHALSEEERLALSGFFAPEILGRARITIVPVIENPRFYWDLERVGVPAPIDFREMTGITFDGTIVVSQAQFPLPSHWTSLVFHEMVHVVQYQLLGVDEFVGQYVRGWAQNGFDYYSIPLERDAYELQACFDAAPGEVFSVAEEVASRLRKSWTTRGRKEQKREV